MCCLHLVSVYRELSPDVVAGSGRDDDAGEVTLDILLMRLDGAFCHGKPCVLALAGSGLGVRFAARAAERRALRSFLKYYPGALQAPLAKARLKGLTGSTAQPR